MHGQNVNSVHCQILSMPNICNQAGNCKHSSENFLKFLIIKQHFITAKNSDHTPKWQFKQ